MDVHDTYQITSKSITVNLLNLSFEYTYVGMADITILVLERFVLV